jgi:hypothetical protein
VTPPYSRFEIRCGLETWGPNTPDPGIETPALNRTRATFGVARRGCQTFRSLRRILVGHTIIAPASHPVWGDAYSRLQDWRLCALPCEDLRRVHGRLSEKPVRLAHGHEHAEGARLDDGAPLAPPQTGAPPVCFVQVR